MGNPVGRPRLKGVSFNPEHAEGKVDAPTVLFEQLYLACPTCGSRLINQHYAFFPSTVYIAAYCERCDLPRSAFFAPEADECLCDTPVVPTELANAQVDAFLAFLASPEDSTESEAP